jgi:hypothetical protein
MWCANRSGDGDHGADLLLAIREELAASAPRRSPSSTVTDGTCPRSTAYRPSTGGTCGPNDAIESSFATVELRTRVTNGAELEEGRARDGLPAPRRRAAAMAQGQRRRARRRRTRERTTGTGIRATDDDTHNETTDEKGRPPERSHVPHTQHSTIAIVSHPGWRADASTGRPS